MFGNWVVGVFMRFNSNGSVVMQRLSSQTEAANAQLLKQQGLIDANEAAMLRYQRRLAEVRAEQMRVGTMFAGGAAVGGFAAMSYAVTQAAQLQTALKTIQIATGANAPQMEAIRQAAYTISSATAQSVTQSAQVLGVMASSGINNPQQLLQIAMPAAKFADVQFLKSGGKVSFEDAARQAIQIAHLYQAYTPAKITPILDTITKLSFMMPDTLNKYLTQAGYYMPLFRRMGVPEEQSAVIGAFLDRMGLGRGKGGTSLQDFVIQSMNSLQQTAHAQSGHLSALQKLGIVGADGRNRFYTTDEHGKTTFDLFGELQQINKALDEQTKGLHGSALTAKRADFINDILSAFKIQGARTGFLATPEGMQQLLGMLKNLKTLPGTDQAQSMYMNTLGGRFQQAVTNFRSVMTELGWPWLGDLTTLFKSIAEHLHGLQVFLHRNKDLDHNIGAVVAIFSTLASVRFAIGLASAARGALGLGGAITDLASSIDLATARILKDDAAIAAGAFVPGAKGATAAEEEPVSRGIGWIVNLFTFGLSGLLAKAAPKIELALTKNVLFPIATFIGKFGKFGSSFSHYVLTLGKDGDILIGLLDRVGLGFLRLIGKLNPVLDVLGFIAGTTAPAGEQGPLMGNTRQYWLNYAKRFGKEALPSTVQWTLYHKYFTPRNSHFDPKKFDRGTEGRGSSAPPSGPLHAKVSFELPRALPKGTKVNVHIQHLLGTHSIAAHIPRAVVVGTG